MPEKTTHQKTGKQAEAKKPVELSEEELGEIKGGSTAGTRRDPLTAFCFAVEIDGFDQ